MLDPASRRSISRVEPVERLHLLDRVALDRGAERLADGAQQVDEDAAAEQLVDLVLARAVAAHQPLQRGRLVRRVVVDVQVRVARAAARMKKSISRSNARRSPSSVNSPSSSRDQKAWNVPSTLEDAEQVVEPVVERVRVALDVEEQVAGRRRRERSPGRAPARSASPRLGQEQLVPTVAVAPALELDPGLLADPLERVLRSCPRAAGSIGSGESPSASSVATPRSVSARRWRARDPGDEAEVVVGAPARDALGRPAADVAVLDRLRVGAGRRVRRPASSSRDRREEPVLGAPVVGHVVVDAEPLDGRGRCRRGRRASTPGRTPWMPLQLVDVGADLEDGARLDVARELRVRDLVVVRAPDGRPVGSSTRSRKSAWPRQRAVEERRLVDDVRARRPSPRWSRRPPRAAASPWSSIEPSSSIVTDASGRRPRGRRGSAARARTRACG